jgi:hypothetical protein
MKLRPVTSFPKLTANSISISDNPKFLLRPAKISDGRAKVFRQISKFVKVKLAQRKEIHSYFEIRKKLVVALGICALSTTAGNALAANLITNGSFEQSNATDGGFYQYSEGQDIFGWAVLGGGVAVVSKSYGELLNGIVAFNSQEGDFSLDLGGGSNNTDGGVQQSFATAVGQSYNVSFWVGQATANPSFGYLSLYDVPVTVDLSISGGPSTSYTNASFSPLGFNNWVQFSTVFTATQTASSVTFTVGGLGAGEVGLENVVISAIPEPAEYAMLLAGLMVVSVIAKRRSKLT